MSDTKTIKAAEDRRVRHETGQLLDPDGATVTWSPYWQRLLDDGDVVETKARRSQEKDS